MGNSNTDHSKKLRRETAIKTTKNKRAEGIYKQFATQGYASDIEKLKENLKQIEGESNAEKLLKATEFYIKHNKNT